MNKNNYDDIINLTGFEDEIKEAGIEFIKKMDTQ